MFGLPPESCSPSGRNPVRFQTGIVFGLERNPHAGGRKVYEHYWSHFGGLAMAGRPEALHGESRSERVRHNSG